jgi:hypothetical protein
MIFVQEEYYDSLSDDIKSVNGNVNAEIIVSNQDVEQLMNAYANLAPVFIENKDLFTVDMILEYIGEKITL